MNRRKFLGNVLGGTAAVAASSTIFSSLSTPAVAAGKKKSVAIIGCGRMGQYYTEVYRALPDAEVVAIAEWNDSRRPAVGKRFGITNLYKDVHSMLKEIVPDVAAIITPTKFMKDAVIACAEAGVKGVSTDKPIAARLSDADAMVDACRKNNVVFAGGNLQRAKFTLQHIAKRLHSGEFGDLRGATIHRFGGEISGGGCQHISVLRLLAQAEVEDVIAWASPPEALAREDDRGLKINGRFRMTSGLEVQVYGESTPYSGVDVWTDDTLIRWNWGAPQLFRGFDGKGARREVDPEYPPFPWQNVLDDTPGLRPSDDYLVSSIRTFLDAVDASSEDGLWISGHDLRQALEVAIASKLSAQLGNQLVKLPLKDRSLVLYPSKYRWVGGDQAGRPQSVEEAAGVAN